ncbi:hypothetical protein Bca4012_038180 [Brassica carinata]
MGITTSSTESNSRYDLVLLDILHKVKEVKLEDMPEKDRVATQGMFEASLEVWWDGLHALFPETKGELSTDEPKEGGTEKDDQVFERFSDFMKEGGCKESFSALMDCVEDTQSLGKCKEHFPILKKCMDARSSYYEPILSLAKATEDKALAFAEEEIQRGTWVP